MNQNFLTIEVTPETYGKMTGHSEEYIRESCLKPEIRWNPEARIRILVPTEDVLDNTWKREGFVEGA